MAVLSNVQNKAIGICVQVCKHGRRVLRALLCGERTGVPIRCVDRNPAPRTSHRLGTTHTHSFPQERRSPNSEHLRSSSGRRRERNHLPPQEAAPGSRVRRRARCWPSRRGPWATTRRMSSSKWHFTAFGGAGACACRGPGNLPASGPASPSGVPRPIPRRRGALGLFLHGESWGFI